MGRRWRTRGEVVAQLCPVLAALRHIAWGALGPRGHVHLLGNDDEPDMLKASKASSDVLHHLSVENRLANLVLDGSGLSQARSRRDGGLFSLALACDVALLLLQDGALGVHCPPGHIARAASGLHDALAVCLSALSPSNGRPTSHQGATCTQCQGCACRVHDPPAASDASGQGGSPPLAYELDWEDAAGAVALVRGVLAPKLLGQCREQDNELVCLDVVEGFVRTAATAEHTPGLVAIAVPGRLQSETRTLPGLFLPTTAPLELEVPLRALTSELARSPKLRALGVGVVVFTCALEPDPPAASPQDPSVDLTHEARPAGDWTRAPRSLQDIKIDLMCRGISELRRAGVRVVASQRVIHPRVMEHCRRAGVVPLHRLGAKHITPFAELCGATPSASLPSDGQTGGLDPRLFGRLGWISLRRFHGKEHVELLPRGWDPVRTGAGPSAPCPIMTVLCCASTEPVARSMVSVIESAQSVLRQASVQPLVVPGAGYCEHHLSRLLDRAVDARTGTHGALWRVSPEGLAWRALSRGLERCARVAAFGIAGAQGAEAEEAAWRCERGREGSAAFWSPCGVHSVGECVVSAERAGDGGWRMARARIVDLAAVKADAIARAVEVAASVVRVAGEMVRDLHGS